MRLLALVLLIAALPSFAEGASPSWLTELFPTAHPAHHRSVHGKPARTKPAKAAAAKDTGASASPADAAATPPVPLPRIRPEQRAAADAAVAPPVAGEAAEKSDAGATPPVPKPAPVAPVTPPPAAGAETKPPATPQPTGGEKPAVPTTPPAKAETPAAPAPGATAPQSKPAIAEGESATAKPPRIYQTACPAVITGLVEAKPLPPISDGMCGTQSPLSVTSILVNGRKVPLTTAATFDCQMATDLPGWVAEVDNYIEATEKTRIKAVTVGGTYECRDRNVAGGSDDLSEHGRADAIDFVGFSLEDGRTLSVGTDYNSADAKTSRLMHFAHDAACTRFTTVLGPDANSLHHDHFHLDLACHGKTCTYRLCE